MRCFIDAWLIYKQRVFHTLTYYVFYGVLVVSVCLYFFQVVAKLVKFEQKNYASAGAIAEEVLSAIRTVAAFGGEDKAVERWVGQQRG